MQVIGFTVLTVVGSALLISFPKRFQAALPTLECSERYGCFQGFGTHEWFAYSTLVGGVPVSGALAPCKN
jgi:hypothetical protein